MCRLRKNGVWHEGHDFRHGALIRKISEQCSLFGMPIDNMSPVVVFGRKYGVRFPERVEWENPNDLLQEYTNVFYTDGSSTENGTGAGWYLDDETKYSCALGKLATVFQTEVFAILGVVNWIIEERWRGRNISICSDSQAALMALETPTNHSKIVLECKTKLNMLSKRNRVCLIWVPGHRGIAGNEICDTLAKEGSESIPLSPEPIIGVSMAKVLHWINSHMVSIHEERWSNLTSCKTTKCFVKGPEHSTAKFLLNLSRKDCRTMVGLITGHNTCGHHMTNMRIIEDPTCASCLEGEDTTEHFLCQCPAFARMRLRILGVDAMGMDMVHSLSLVEILRFAKNTRKFD